ncbi:hypothetical protein AAHH67_05245 [Niallia circulans]
MKISKFVHAEEDIWEERLNGQWKRHERRAIQEAVQPFIDNPKWSQLALDVLQSSEKVDFRAMEIARFYQLDITALLFEKLKKEPTNSILYGAIMETRDLQSIQDLCAFAETHFSISSLSLEEQYCLEYIIQDLHEFEGVGAPLVRAALETKNESLRWQGLSVLAEWSPAIRQLPEIQHSLRTIISTTKDKEERKLAKQLVR